MSKPKKFTLTALDKLESKQFGGKRAVMVQDLEVIIDEVFRPMSLQLCMSEMIDKFVVMNQSGIVNKYSQGAVYAMYPEFILLKHFSNLPIPETFEDQMKIMIKLYNTGFLEELLSHFAKTEITKWEEMCKNIDQYSEQFAEYAIEYEKINQAKVKDGEVNANGKELDGISQDDSGQSE